MQRIALPQALPPSLPLLPLHVYFICSICFAECEILIANRAVSISDFGFDSCCCCRAYVCPLSGSMQHAACSRLEQRAAARRHVLLRFPTIFVIYLEKSADSTSASACASASVSHRVGVCRSRSCRAVIREILRGSRSPGLRKELQQQGRTAPTPRALEMMLKLFSK